jgi:ATP-dependent DNA helicase RecQ
LDTSSLEIDSRLLAGKQAQEARRLLGVSVSPDAEFHGNQLEAIVALAVQHRRLLLVERTGWGKSMVYFIATRLLRDQGMGPTIVISPLLVLMRNQLEMAERAGLVARTMNSQNPDDHDQIKAELAADEVDLLLVSPERLANRTFISDTLLNLPKGFGMIVVDEAHCISDWGHDFRLDYRRIVDVNRFLPGNVPVLGTTATANDRVVADVREQLGGLEVVRGPLARQSLRLQNIRLDDQAQRLAWLADHLPGFPGAGVIYCLTIRDCERVSQWLRLKGIEAYTYHSKLDRDTRLDLEAKLIENRLKALVATIALGMGFDKPDLGFVIHFQRPGSVIGYYQQIGRAGRQLDEAFAILLSGREDDEIQDYFISTAFPGVEEQAMVAQAIQQSGPIRTEGLLEILNLPRSRVDKALDFLELVGAIARSGSDWVRTARAWHPDEQLGKEVSQTRREELDQMRAYVDSRGCLMEEIGRALDDPWAEPCGRCANCAGEPVDPTVDHGLLLEAVDFLKRRALPIASRKQWLKTAGRPFNIPKALQCQEGRALCAWGDAGWGELVREGKRTDNRFSDELVAGLADLVREWSPEPFPTWVTSVPSFRHQDLVPEFAARLARALGLEYRSAMRKVRNTAPQKSMANSYRQASNLAGAFEAVEGEVTDGAVFLIDDIVDSKWTFTECGACLLEAGSGPVYPLALADASSRSDW